MSELNVVLPTAERSSDQQITSRIAGCTAVRCRADFLHEVDISISTCSIQPSFELKVIRQQQPAKVTKQQQPAKVTSQQQPAKKKSAIQKNKNKTKRAYLASSRIRNSPGIRCTPGRQATVLQDERCGPQPIKLPYSIQETDLNNGEIVEEMEVVESQQEILEKITMSELNEEHAGLSSLVEDSGLPRLFPKNRQIPGNDQEPDSDFGGSEASAAFRSDATSEQSDEKCENAGASSIKKYDDQSQPEHEFLALPANTTLQPEHQLLESSGRYITSQIPRCTGVRCREGDILKGDLSVEQTTPEVNITSSGTTRPFGNPIGFGTQETALPNSHVESDEEPMDVDSPEEDYETEKMEVVESRVESQQEQDEAVMQFQGFKLAKKVLFGKSDLYLIIYRRNENMSFTEVYRTEAIKNTPNPTWKPFRVPLRTLCDGDLDRTIKVECFNWKGDGNIDLIGEFTTNMRRFVKGSQRDNIYLITKKKSKKKGKTYGTISLMSCRVQKMYCYIILLYLFLDFIHGGTKLSFVVAINFSASNGAPHSPQSLHHINPHMPNQYEQAIQSVGTIIKEYDTDKLFPVFGFGAKLPPNGAISHDFPVNFNYQNPFVSNVDGIIGAYRNCLPQIQLHGPTNFAPIINRVARDAQAFMNGSNFFVLLIITDGIISDMDFTKVAVINASKLPMAIIIVGVGNADFSAMEHLDSDDNLLRHGVKVADHDIVQFVPFSEIVHRSGNRDMGAIQAQLAKEVLEEIPDQLVTWMKLHHIKPGTAPPPYSAVGRA
ncbi:copine-8-like [Antedon mediterranea]|uniref:copine-8-like n=1 Tax=Antedon mediterranea TaxID=105859 RepID=UPI003AF4A767